MMKTGILVISNPNTVLRALPILQNQINNTLYIQYFPSFKWTPKFTLRNSDLNLNQTQDSTIWPVLSSSVLEIYSKTLSYNHLDVRVLLSGVRNNQLSKVITKSPVEVVYYDQLFNREDVHDYIHSFVKNISPNCQVIAIPDQEVNLVIQDNSDESSRKSNGDHVYDNVVLGGTFDRLHCGHKILLSEAILRCRRTITVGVTDAQMLKSKKLWELVEPCQYRIQRVKDFLEEIEPTLQYHIIPINDIFGPTKDDPTFQMIVVSAETVSGAGKINEIRVTNGLNHLYVHKVELMADVNKEDEEEEEKISSSNLRLRSLGTLIRPPKPNPNLAEKPYIVGLTGGIASGKTNIGRCLATLGAEVIDCDRIGHEVYQPGSDGHRQVVARFGSGILDTDGAIDRKKLAAIVFSNKEELEALNALVWPLILAEALARASRSQREVVVLEAAVLIRAQWTAVCHEVWVSIVPPQEAIKRVVERNGLTEEEAKARVESQPSNLEQVEHANVVLSSLWRPEFTQKQVKKAWTCLAQRLRLK